MKALFKGNIHPDKQDEFVELMNELSARFKEKELRPKLEQYYDYYENFYRDPSSGEYLYYEEDSSSGEYVYYETDPSSGKDRRKDDISNSILNRNNILNKTNIIDNIINDIINDDVNKIINQTINGTTSCICNYDYYTDDNKDITSQSLLPPSTWAEDIKNNCIEIVDHALDLAGYKDYLKKYEKELRENYDICCSINYYYDRNGKVAFHQDSFGRELFVLLIYFDTVDGPEWELKDPKEFEARMKYISKKKLMPEVFIEDVKRVYDKMSTGLNKELNEEKELYGGIEPENIDSVEWAGRVEGPGGIVGFVDEVIIHSTPHMQHRQANGALLLKLLNKMKDTEKKDLSPKKLDAISFLQTTIQEISEVDEQPILIYELQRIIQDTRKATENIFGELYRRLGESTEYDRLSLSIIEEIKNTKMEGLEVTENKELLLTELKAINLLEITIQRIPKESDHYITIAELERITQDTEKAMENMEKILYELYINVLDTYEAPGSLLLKTLEEMTVTEKQELLPKDVDAINFLENTIKKIYAENDHYITIAELQRIIDESNESKDEKLRKPIIDTLNKLYKKLGKLEAFSKDGDLVLGRSEHEIDDKNDISNTIKTFSHTGSKDRRRSLILRDRDAIISSTSPSTSSPIISEAPEKRRSFLRVWVTALPKSKKEEVVEEK